MTERNMDENIDPTEQGDLVPTEALFDEDQAEADSNAIHFDDLPDPPETLGYTQAGSMGDDSADAAHGASLEAVFDVPVKVQAVLGRARMPIAELVSMRPGYVVELDRRVGEAIDILVNNRLIARGEIVMIDGSLGVTLTEIVKQSA